MNELHQRYLKDFQLDWNAGSEVREQSNEEYRFTTVPGAQWEDWLEDAYEDRARLELNHCSSYVNRNLAQWTQNRQIPNYQASDDATSDDLAELMDSVLRRDLRKDGGQSAIDTAIKEAFSCGFGAFILKTRYEDEGDPENDNQDIVIAEQPNAYNTVVFDSGAKTAEKVDAKRCVVLTPITKEAFEDQYPDKSPHSLDPPDRGWFNWNHNDLIYIAERYEIKRESYIKQTWTHPESGDILRLRKDEVADDVDQLEMAGYTLGRERKVTRQRVYKSVFTGSDILEPARPIVGKYIPVVPIYAHRAWVDGVEQFHGLVRPVMDAQRILNMAFSLAAEGAAHSSETKPIFLAEQMQNPQTQADWQNAHNKPYLTVDPVRDGQGNIVAAGPTAMLPGTAMSPILTDLLGIATESIVRSTGGMPQDTIDPESSGKAINAMIKRIDLDTATVHDNINKGIKHFGRVYGCMAPEVYSSQPNRYMRVISERGESQGVKLNSTQGVAGKLLAVNDLSKGKYDVVVNTSTDYQTAKEETFEAMKDVISVMPDAMPEKTDFLKHLILLKEGQGLEGLQKQIRNQLILQGKLEPESEEEAQMLQRAQAAAQQQGLDPNSAYLMAEAEKAKTDAQLSLAKIAGEMADATKTAKEAEELNVDIALKKQELMQGQAVQ